MADYVRLTDILRSYWDGLEKVNGIPREADIDAAVLEQVWADCYLTQVLNGAPYQYDYLGETLIKAYGDDTMQGEVRSLVYPSIGRVSEKFADAIKGGVPLVDGGEFINDHNMLIKFRQLILPFGDSTGKITHLLGGMRWRAF
jgi:hypothetical protein